jgi:hypothetical protein
MQWTQQQAWTATICSATFAFISLNVAVIANWEKLAKFFKAYKRPVWLVGLMVVIVLLILGGWFGWVPKLFHWFGSDIQVSKWFLCLTWLAGCLTPVIVAGVLAILFHWRSSQAGVTNQNDWKRYTSDIIFGVRWEWDYLRDSLTDVTAYCPNTKCNCRLDLVKDYGRSGYNEHVPVSLVCPHCNFKTECDWDEHELRRRVRIEIDRRLRTNEYVKNLEARQPT